MSACDRQVGARGTDKRRYWWAQLRRIWEIRLLRHPSNTFAIAWTADGTFGPEPTIEDESFFVGYATISEAQDYARSLLGHAAAQLPLIVDELAEHGVPEIPFDELPPPEYSTDIWGCALPGSTPAERHYIVLERTIDLILSSVAEETYRSMTDFADAGAAEMTDLPARTAPAPCDEEDAIADLTEDPEECLRNPTAVIPDWTTQTLPFLNNRECEYFVPILTTYDCPGAEELPARVEEFLGQAIEELMVFLNKQYSATDYRYEPVRVVLNDYVLNRGGYEFDKAPTQKLRLLYKFPVGLIRALRLQDIPPIPIEDVETPIENESARLKLANLFEKIGRLRQALGVLAKQQLEILQATQTQLVINGSQLEINLTREAEDVDKLKTTIQILLSDNGYMLPGTTGAATASRIPPVNERLPADELKIYYDSAYKITQAFAREVGSSFIELTLGILSRPAGTLSPALVAYLVRIDEILADFERTEPIGVVEFVEKYHFPLISTTQPSAQTAPPPPSEDGSCEPQIVADARNSVLRELTSAGELFVSKFAKYSCMTQQKKTERDLQLRESLDELKSLLQEEGSKFISNEDQLWVQIPRIIDQINESQSGLDAAWDKLFDKLTACGLLKLIMQTVQFIGQNDICGISAEDALKTAIKAILRKADSDILLNLFESLPSPTKIILEGQFVEEITPFITEVGYSLGASLPWEYAQQQQEQEERDELGILFYGGASFTPLTPAQRAARQVSSNEAGRAVDFSDGVPRLPQEENAFWQGYVQGTLPSGDLPTLPGAPPLADPGGFTPAPPPPASPAQNQVNLARETAVQVTDTFVDVLQNNLSFDELIAATQDIPAIGLILKVTEGVTECIDNGNTNSSIKTPNMSMIQNNLDKLGEKDICDLVAGLQPPGKPGKKKKGPAPIALPDMEMIMKQQVQTMWSAFQDALVETLRETLRSVLVKAVLELIKLATEVTSGALCDAARGTLNALAAGEAPTTNIVPGSLRDLFGAAFCGLDTPSADVDAQITDALSRLSGVDSESVAAATAAGGLIDELANRLRMDQMLDLLEGNANNRTVEIVLETTAGSDAFGGALGSAESVRNFFNNLGSAFPPDFLDRTRDALDPIFSHGEGPIADICTFDRSAARENLANALREDCGDGITESQIEDQISNFESRVGDILDVLASNLATGGDAGLTETVEDLIRASVPRDEPGNLRMAEQIVSLLFDPLYVTYSQDLMRPLQPNTNAGFLNLVLANRNGIPQRGQIANYKAAKAFLTFLAGPAALFAPDAVSDAVSEDLEAKFFGDDGPLKPSTVATSLKDYLEGFEISGTGEEITLVYETTEYTGPARIFSPSNFTLRYNFNTGEFNLVFGFALTPPGPRIRPPMSFTVTSPVTLEGLEEAGDLVGLIEATDPLPERAPVPMGAGLLQYQQQLYGLLDLLSAPELESYYRDNTLLVGIMRNKLISYLANSIAENERAFTYGSYVLENDRFSEAAETLGDPEMPLDGIPREAEGFMITPMPTGEIAVLPPAKGGWLEFKDNLILPSEQGACCPDRRDLFDVESIKNRVLEGYKEADDDPRLSLNPRTVSEPPYAKILSRMNLAAMEGTVTTTIRTYIIEYFMKGMASFTKFKTTIPQTYSEILPTYIAEKMKSGLRASGPFPGAPTFPPVVPPLPPTPAAPDGNLLFSYWYEFLEQAAQTVSRRVKAGTMQPNEELRTAMTNIQLVVEGYEYPQLLNLFLARPLISPDPIAQLSVTLKKYRQKLKIDAIRNSEQDAMVILKYLIMDEYARIADDVESIFAAPEGGWIEDLYEEMLRKQTFGWPADGTSPDSIVRVNIFDVPASSTSTTRPSRLGGLSSFISSDVDRLGEGQLMLQSYVRAVRGAAPRAGELTTFVDGQIYGTQEIYEVMAAAGDFGAPISDFFESFKYGLRLVYVLGTEDAADALRARMGTVFGPGSRDNTNRLFQHTGLAAGGVGLYSVPIVYSEDIEEEFDTSVRVGNYATDSLGFIDFNGGFSLDEESQFNWNVLLERLKTNQQFQLMFGYSIPLTHALSLMTIYQAEAFLSSVGKAGDDWYLNYDPVLPPRVGIGVPPTRVGGAPNNYYRRNRKVFPVLCRKLKRVFKEIYNSDDFSYEPERFGQESRDQVNDIRNDTAVDSWSRGLSPELRDRLIEDTRGCGDYGVVSGESDSEPPPTRSTERPDETPEVEDTITGDSGGPLRSDTPLTETDPDDLPDVTGGAAGSTETPYVCISYYYDASFGLGGTYAHIVPREELEDTLATLETDRYSSVTVTDAPGATGPLGPSRDFSCSDYA